RIQLFSSYFSKLNNLQNNLNKYIICEKHYNQIVAKDNYLDYLKNRLSDYPRKRSRNFKNLSDNNDPILNKDQITNVDIGIQVTTDSDHDLLIQIDALKNSLSNIVTDHAQQLQAIQTKNNKILELEHKCESLKKQIANLNIQLK
ncbi:11292_t:CDS:1, partial [Gigaspora margarita]